MRACLIIAVSFCLAACAASPGGSADSEPPAGSGSITAPGSITASVHGQTGATFGGSWR